MAEVRGLECILEFIVRDSELDAFGVVNHARYFHYLEHARHRMFAELGFQASDHFHGRTSLVVAQLEARYLKPLVSGDRFQVRTTMDQVSRVKMIFRQRILRLPEALLIFEAKVVAAAVSADGKPLPLPDGLRESLMTYLEK